MDGSVDQEGQSDVSMKATVLRTNAEGATTFEVFRFEISGEVYRPGGTASVPLLRTAAVSSDDVHLIALPPGYEGPWHCAPALKLGVVVAGGLRLESTSGAHVYLSQGSLFAAADLHGLGHRGVADADGVVILYATLKTAADLETMLRGAAVFGSSEEKRA